MRAWEDDNNALRKAFCPLDSNTCFAPRWHASEKNTIILSETIAWFTCRCDAEFNASGRWALRSPASPERSAFRRRLEDGKVVRKRRTQRSMRSGVLSSTERS
jgi:hypothetical protein